MGGDLPPQLNLRPHLAALARNETLLLVADGHAAQALWRAPVLGVDVYLAPGPMSIGPASGAPVLPAFVVDDLERRDPIGLRLIIHPPLELQVSADAKSDLEANLARFAAAFEAQVRTHPHVWRQWTAMLGSPAWFERHGRGERPTVELAAQSAAGARAAHAHDPVGE